MNRKNAKEIAGLSAAAYGDLGLLHQEWMIKYGEGLRVEHKAVDVCPKNCRAEYWKFRDNWNEVWAWEFFRDSHIAEGGEWRIKPDTIDINGIECAVPLCWADMKVGGIFFCENICCRHFYNVLRFKGDPLERIIVDAGCCYDKLEKAVTACKARYGVGQK